MNAERISIPMLDELSQLDDDSSNYMKAYLNSIEMLAKQWNITKKSNYDHRTRAFPEIEDMLKNTIPRSV
jgi:hypothetical protein